MGVCFVVVVVVVVVVLARTDCKTRLAQIQSNQSSLFLAFALKLSGDYVYIYKEQSLLPKLNSASQFHCICVDIHLRRHAGVKGNDRADRLAGKATLTSGLLLGRSEVLRSLRHYPRAQSQGHHSIDRLEERSEERGSARRSSFKGRERAIVSQTNIGTVSKATLGKFLRDVMERTWAFPSA